MGGGGCLTWKNIDTKNVEPVCVLNVASEGFENLPIQWVWTVMAAARPHSAARVFTGAAGPPWRRGQYW